MCIRDREVSLGSTQNWGGVKFSFQQGASTDFPAASIIIGGKAVSYTHLDVYKRQKENNKNLNYIGYETYNYFNGCFPLPLWPDGTPGTKHSLKYGTVKSDTGMGQDVPEERQGEP